MTIILAGLSHRTTPLALRERLYQSPEMLQTAFSSLRSTLAECAILSTCNRLEIYGVTDQPETAFKRVENFLAESQQMSPEHLYTMTGPAAVQHILRVASGLDSVVLGESQILGQISSAGEAANGTVISRLFMHAVHTGKRARTETSISRHPTSISHAAAALAQQQLEDLSRVRALVIGAGEMAGLAVRALQNRGAAHIEIINRSDDRAESLAALVGGYALPWADLADAVNAADLVIAATSAPEPVLRSAQIHRPLLLIDIGMPRNIDPLVDDLPGITRFDLDDLRGVVDENLAQRRVCVPAVEMIVGDETSAFMDWLHGWQVGPVIGDLRRRAEAVAQAEVEQTLKRIGDCDHRTQEMIERMAHRIVNKLLHEPTVRLRQHADYADVVRELFALEES